MAKKIIVDVPQKEVNVIQAKVLNRKLVLICIGALLAVTVLAFAVSSITTRSKSKSSKADKVIIQTRKILLLSDDAEPTVIEVSDVHKLKNANPTFYQDVQQGDYLLMYPEMAVIYRQETNQFINVAPFTGSKE